MGKHWKKWIVPLILIILGGVCAMVFSFITGMKFKNQELRNCSYSLGGGMLGGHWSVTLSKEKDGRTLLTVTERATHADREITTVYPADPAAFDTLKEMAERYRLYAASKRPYRDEHVLDGDTSSLGFSYSEGSFRISSEQSMDRKMSEGFGKVREFLYSLAVGDGVRTVEPQRATLYLKSGYTLQFEVAEAFDGKLDAILSTKYVVSPYEDCGIVLNETRDPEIAGASPDGPEAFAGQIVYEPESGKIILLHADHDFGHPVCVLAGLDHSANSASPLIREMEGEYSLYLNK